jgi:hypothetical protein
MMNFNIKYVGLCTILLLGVSGIIKFGLEYKSDKVLISEAIQEIKNYCSTVEPGGQLRIISNKKEIQFSCGLNWKFGIVLVEDLPLTIVP